MGLMKMSEVAAYNNAPHEARNYRVALEPVDGFNPGDYVPVVVYNAFVGSNGKGMRSLAQKTHAHLFRDHAVLDEFDPSIDFSRTPDGHALFELVGYLIDLNGKEHLFFQSNSRRTKSNRRSCIRLMSSQLAPARRLGSIAGARSSVPAPKSPRFRG